MNVEKRKGWCMVIPHKVYAFTVNEKVLENKKDDDLMTGTGW